MNIQEKIKVIEERLEDATYEHNRYIKKLQLRILDLQDKLEVTYFKPIESCGKTFNTQKEFNKHKKSNEYRKLHEKWIKCLVCRKTFYGFDKEEYDNLSTADKLKTNYYTHLNDCIYCTKCDTQFKNHMHKKRHKCDEEIEETPQVKFVPPSNYDTFNDEIEIDKDFNYFRLDSLSKRQAIQLKSYIESLDESQYSITEITDCGLHYIVYENDEDTSNKEEVFRFRVPTRDEDLQKRLQFNTVKII